MADSSKSPVARLIDAARQVVQTVTPRMPQRARPRQRRVIPPTVPPKLREGRGAAVRGARAVRDTEAREDRRGAGVAYEDWTKADLYRRAQELDVDGRSKMSKDELISALRSRS